MAQLKADATQVGHDFDGAFTDDDRAGGEILARGASGWGVIGLRREDAMAEGRVTATRLNLRDAPNGAAIGRLSNGDSVMVLATKGAWLSVSATIGGATKRGWVSAKFVQTESAVPPPADDDAKPVTVAGRKAIAPDGTSFANVRRNGFGTLGQTTVDAWLAGNPSGLTLAPSLIRVVRAVSRNEGRLEAINSYDSAFLSFGIFQWTAGTADHPGELAGLLALIQRTSTDTFQSYFGRYGLGIALQGVGETGFLTLAGLPLKEPADKAKLRAVEWAYRFWRAGKDDTVRACELSLAAARVPGFLRLPAAGYSVGDWLTSEYGVALVLDEHVNRPGHVPRTLAKAISRLPSGTGPAGWGDQEEAELIDLYIAARKATNMTAPAKRADNLGDCVNAGMISDKRGSFVATTTAAFV